MNDMSLLLFGLLCLNWLIHGIILLKTGEDKNYICFNIYTASIVLAAILTK